MVGETQGKANAVEQSFNKHILSRETCCVSYFTGPPRLQVKRTRLQCQSVVLHVVSTSVGKDIAIVWWGDWVPPPSVLS